MTDAPDSPRPLTLARVRYPAGTREHAFELWAFTCGRDCTSVVRALTGAGYDPCPTDRQVRRWAVQGAWAEEADRRVAALAPELHRQVDAGLLLAGGEAVAALRGILTGVVKPSVAVVSAAMAVLDRSGHPARTEAVIAHVASPAVPRLTAAELARLSPAERAVLLARLTGQPVALPPPMPDPDCA